MTDIERIRDTRRSAIRTRTTTTTRMVKSCTAIVPVIMLLSSSDIFTATDALSSTNASSPWKTASWKLILNIGREQQQSSDNDKLPEESWGASGARLSFPIELQVLADPALQQDPLLGGRGANQLKIMVNEDDPSSGSSSGTYITEQGQKRVPLQADSGGWKLRLGRKKGHASMLQFWLDLGGKEDAIIAQKKDVTLRGNERLYFAAHCWREKDYAIGKRGLQPILKAYEIAQSKLVEKVDHDSGDRRLDGTDALETLSAYKDMAGLTLDRDDKWRQLQEAQEYLPPPEELPLGDWPGDTELMAIKPMELFVRKTKGLFGAQEEFHLIGTWEARPIIVEAQDDDYEYYDEAGGEDDEYEYYDDDDDDDDDDDEEETDDDGKAAVINEEGVSTTLDLTFENDGPIDRPIID